MDLSSKPLRTLHEYNPPSQAAVSPFAMNVSSSNTTEDPCHCYLWKVPTPLSKGNSS